MPRRSNGRDLSREVSASRATLGVMFDCTLRINTPERHDEWEDSRASFSDWPNPHEILTLPDGREIEVIGSGVIDRKNFTWATEVAPVEAA